MTAVATAMSSLKSAVDITKAMVDLNTAQAVSAKVFELNRHMLEAQQAIFAANDERAALIERVRELKQQIARAGNWDAEKQRYELKELAPGVMAYAVKAEVKGLEPKHQLSPRCYEDGQKSILQGQTREQYAGAEAKACSRCGLKLEYYRSDLPPSPPRPVRRMKC